jgi:hypothetical protein
MAQTYEQRLAYNRDWVKKNPDKRAIQNANYRERNRNRINENQNKRRIEKILENPEYQPKINRYTLNRTQNILKSWIGFIPEETQCQCCSKPIFFARQTKKDAIHFDHRHGGNEIISPTNWLKIHPRNPKNEKLWKSFDFGYLCRDCNLFLPTEGRLEFLEKAINYAKAI